jgi:hypothetical protein
MLIAFERYAFSILHGDMFLSGTLDLFASEGAAEMKECDQTHHEVFTLMLHDHCTDCENCSCFSEQAIKYLLVADLCSSTAMHGPAKPIVRDAAARWGSFVETHSLFNGQSSTAPP